VNWLNDSELARLTSGSIEDQPVKRLTFPGPLKAAKNNIMTQFCLLTHQARRTASRGDRTAEKCWIVSIIQVRRAPERSPGLLLG